MSKPVGSRKEINGLTTPQHLNRSRKMLSRDSLEMEYSRLIAAAGVLQGDLRKCPDETGLFHTLEKQLLNQLGEVLTAIAVLQWAMGYPTAATPSSQALRHRAHAGAASALQLEIAGQADQVQAGGASALQLEIGGQADQVQAYGASALQPELAGQARAAAAPTQRAELAPQACQGGAKVALLGLRWEVLPSNYARAELPFGVVSLLEKCGRTLFSTKAEPRLYLFADYDPDVARMLAQGVPELKGAALRCVRNLLDELGHAEWDLEEELKKPGAAMSGGEPHAH